MTGIITVMDIASVSTTFVAFLLVAGAIAAIIHAATTGARRGGGTGWAAARREEREAEVSAPTCVTTSGNDAANPELVIDQEPLQPSPPAIKCSQPPEVRPVWNVPHARNRHFVGRRKTLEEIRSALVSGRNVSLVEKASDLGGLGKTQLAVEYAYTYADDYQIVWWIRASHSSAIGIDFACLAAKLGMKLDDAKPELVREAVVHTLCRVGRWLLIFDDARDADTVGPYIPASGGHVIITSREPDWWHLSMPLFAQSFERIESIDFIFGRTTQTNGAVVAQLAGLLQDLPLALDHACAYMNRAGKSCTDYLTLGRTHYKQIATSVSYSMTRQDVISITLAISLPRVEKESQAAAHLLKLCAFLAPDAIPLGPMREAMRHLPGNPSGGLADSEVFKEAVAVLRRYSLVEANEDCVRVHRLVQSSMRGRMCDDEKHKYASEALAVLDGVFTCDSRNPRSMEICAAMITHVLAAVDYAEELDISEEKSSALLQEVSVFLRSCGDLGESRVLADRALVMAEITFGSSHPRVAICADNLGSTLHQLGDLAAARSQYERALKIDEAAYGPNHPNVASRLGSLGDVLWESGSPVAARPLLERALKIAESAYGANHANVAVRAAGLGQALEAMDDLKGALEQFERALAIDEASFGPTHPSVALRVHSLGQVLLKQGDFSRARVCFERALRIEQSAFGHDHPRVAVRVTNLGRVLEDSGDLEGARDCYEEALAIDEAVYGPSHPSIAARVEALGRVLEGMGDLKAAKDYYRQALAICEAIYGPEHPNVAARVTKIGQVFAAMGDLFSAREQFERALETHQAVYGLTHCEVADDLVRLSEVTHALGDSKGARVQLGRALLIRQEQLGPQHPDTETVRRNLAAFAY